MKAIEMPVPGGPEVLELVDAPDPAAGSGEVLVAVELAGVNFGDINARRGTYAGRGVPFRSGLGLEVYGHVAGLGPGVSAYSVGDRVAGFCRSPGYADLAVCDQRLLWRVPDGIPDSQAAAFPVVGQTAFHLLRSAARMLPGESVLITAAAGGVGSAAIQVARCLRAGTIVGAAGSAERAEQALALGADASVDYSRAQIAQSLEAVTGARFVDVALDAVGGPVRADAFDCLAPFGRLIQYGNSSGEPEMLPDSRSLRDRLVSVGGVRLAQVRVTVPEMLQASGNQLLGWLGEGRLRIPIASVLPLEQAAEAHKRLESRTVVGKLLLAVG